MPIREGLARLDGVESISPRPDVKAGTCELRLKDGRLLKPDFFSQFIYDIRVGARLRGIEATVSGSLEKRGRQWFLRIAGSDELLRLAPLKVKVQHEVSRKKPQAATKAETKTFRKLGSAGTKTPGPVQITGPLRENKDDGLTLEVRHFDFTPRAGRPPGG